MESHQRDHENFLVVSRNRRRRAKALLDFERHDDDELGFRKNDIITVSHDAHKHVHPMYTYPLTSDRILSHCVLIFLDNLTEGWTLLGWRAQWPQRYVLSYVSTPNISIWITFFFVTFLTAHLIWIFCGSFMTGWFPAKFVEILDERSKEVWKQLVSLTGLFLCWLLFTQNMFRRIFNIFVIFVSVKLCFLIFPF